MPNTEKQKWHTLVPKIIIIIIIIIISNIGFYNDIFFSLSGPQLNNGKKQQHNEIFGNGLVPVDRARRPCVNCGGMVVGQ